MLKKETRVIGIDDSPFNKLSKGDLLLVGVIMRGSVSIDGVLSTKAAIDGTDSTQKIINMIASSKFKTHIRCIFLDGISVGGFNVVDINRIYKELKIPVIVVMRKTPDTASISKTLIKLGKSSQLKLIENAGRIYSSGKIFIQLAGLDKDRAVEFLNLTCTRSFIPEPLRLAHIISSGIITGESKGRA